MRSMFSLAVAAGAAILFLGCGGAEEVATPTPVPTTPAVTASATPSPAPTEVPTPAPSATPTLSATQVPTDTPVPTTPSGSGGGGGEIGPGTVITPPPKPPSEPVPPDWGTLVALDHTIRHPDTWFSKPNQVSSFTFGGGSRFPADGIRIDFGIALGSHPAPKEASAFSVDGLAGWEVVRSYDPLLARGIAQTHDIFVEGDGFSATFAVGFGPDSIDEDLVWQIVYTFEPVP